MTEQTDRRPRGEAAEGLEYFYRVQEWRWTEPFYDLATGEQVRAGFLYRSEPDAGARALARIELRAVIDTLTNLLGEPVDVAATIAAQERDRQRIADDAVEDLRGREWESEGRR